LLIQCRLLKLLLSITQRNTTQRRQEKKVEPGVFAHFPLRDH